MVSGRLLLFPLRGDFALPGRPSNRSVRKVAALLAVEELYPVMWARKLSPPPQTGSPYLFDEYLSKRRKDLCGETHAGAVIVDLSGPCGRNPGQRSRRHHLQHPPSVLSWLSPRDGRTYGSPKRAAPMIRFWMAGSARPARALWKT